MKVDVFKTAQKVYTHFGYFCKKICQLELSKLPNLGALFSTHSTLPR